MLVIPFFVSNDKANFTCNSFAGNDNLYALIRVKQYTLRIDLGDFNDSFRHADYNNFKISSDCDKFKLLSIGTYRGTAGRDFVNLLPSILKV